MQILVIEDSPRLRKSLTVGLSKLGHTVRSAADGEEGLALALAFPQDIILLDIMLPKLDGFSVLRQIRYLDNETNVIMLTAKDDIEDRVQGLDLGADDYLCKPFAFDELEARINAVNRRSHMAKSPTLQVNQLTLELSRKEVCVENRRVDLTPKEYLIVEQLMLNHGRVVSYESLENLVLDGNYSSGRNAIEAHVSSLRKKLKMAGAPKVIQTKRNFGYMAE